MSSVKWFNLDSDNVLNNCYLFNGIIDEIDPSDPNAVVRRPRAAATHHASQQFIGSILDELRMGFGFVPFIAAGFSVTAGIPIIKQVKVYLQRCICLALGAESVDPDRPAELWNPRTDRWPPFIDRRRPQNEDYWLDKMCERLKYERRMNNWDRVPLFQEAYGAMAEWRVALNFLSRIQLKEKRKEGVPDTQPYLGVPDPDVIDGFWREVTRNKTPALNHRLLAGLAGLLRIDLILTTNFDHLTEQAFAAARNPLEVFDVHLDDSLPTLAAVTSVRAIIKLHGSLRSLRADYSLDGPPSQEDRNIFLEYLAGKRIPNNDRELIKVKNHLLVLGVGGTEQRSLGFILEAARRTENLKIFWVCYSELDVKVLLKQLAGVRDLREPQFFILRQTELGLLFLHMYQAVRKTIPAHDAMIASTTRLALPPLPWDNRPVEDVELLNCQKKIEDQIADKSPQRNLVIATAGEDIYGLSSVGARVFRKLERDNACIWLDMNDIHSADDLFEAFQEAVFRKLGEADWTPLYSENDSRPRRREVQRIIQASLNPWILFLNAREVPGANRYDTNLKNGWFDKPRQKDNDPPSACLESLMELLAEMTTNSEGRLKVVILCTGLDAPIVNELGQHVTEVVQLSKRLPGLNEKRVVIKESITWTAENEPERGDRQRFLQTLVSAQRPRHLSMAWGKCVNPQWELSNIYDEQRPLWLDRLEQIGMIRRMDGGFIWFHSAFRQHLRRCLALTEDKLEEIAADSSKQDEYCLDPESVGVLRSWAATGTQADIHVSLSTWYRKVFDSTGFATAIFEIIEHLCLAAESFIRFGAKGTQAQTNGWKRAGHLIDTARELLEEHHFLIQTQGHPRNSIRHTDYIRDFWVVRHNPFDQDLATFIGCKIHGPHLRFYDSLVLAIVKLQCSATEVARGIAREIGEDREAYELLSEGAFRRTKDIPLNRGDVRAEIKHLPGKIAKRLIPVFNSDQKLLYEWVRWWRWCGMLGNSSRSFDEACHSISRGLDAAKHGVVKVRSFGGTSKYSRRNIGLLRNFPLADWISIEDGWRKNGKHLNTCYSDNPAKFYLEVLHTLEVAAATLGLKATTLAKKHELQSQSPAIDKEIVAYLEKGHEFAIKGLEFVEQAQTSGLKPANHDFELMWCKSRLLMQAALTSLHKPELKDYSRHAMSLLGDASASLNVTSLERTRADMALVDLRRAQIRLHEAGDICLYQGGGWRGIDGVLITDKYGKEYKSKGFRFQNWIYDRLRGVDIQPPSTDNHKSQRQILEDLKEDLSLTRTEEWRENLRLDLTKIKARAMDALRFLDRAEPLLRERRRNVWWTTWYFERRLRAMSYILWTAVVENDVPIPFLGLEAAMRLTDTIADNLLEDASRMIRVDAYRFAMVVLEYASCARALRLRLVLDSNTVWLEERLAVMRQNLRRATAQLGVITALRTSGASRLIKRSAPGSIDKVGLTQSVSDIIGEVLAIAKDVASDLDLARKEDRFTEKQVIEMLKQHAEILEQHMTDLRTAKLKTAELCSKRGITAAVLYAWKSKYGGVLVTTT